MQITIDTANDSHESIRKAIEMLQSIIGEKAFINSPEAKPVDIFGAPAADIFAAEEAKPSGESLSAMNMFDSPSQASSTPIEIMSEQPAQPPQAKPDEEPLQDEELFADLFTKEELERMSPRKPEKQEKPYSRVYF